MTPTKQHHVLVLLLLLVSSYSIGTAAKHNTTVPCLPDQASALLQLKRSFIHIDDPKAFSSWRAGSDCCRWQLVTCDMASGRVISLDLRLSNLKSLDPVLFNLSSLESLGLNTAGISKELSSLSKLHSLNELQLNGCDSEKVIILSWIGNLQRLTTLGLECYDFSRSGSSWIGNLSSLARLEFLGCNFSGPIPYQIGNLANLEALDVEGCGSTRQPFPSWIGNLTKLVELGLQGCSFSEPMPSTIWNLTKLEVIQIGFNNLSEMKKWYVVYEGTVPEVYDQWEDCLKQVNKFEGNSYKGYKSKEEAEARWRRNRMKTSFIVIPILLIVTAFLLYVIVV